MPCGERRRRISNKTEFERTLDEEQKDESDTELDDAPCTDRSICVWDLAKTDAGNVDGNHTWSVRFRACSNIIDPCRVTWNVESKEEINVSL